MSIRPYTGEYLVSPVPVHLGLNYCSHNCFYCYANLNNPDRRADYNKVINVANAVANNKPMKNLSVRYLQAGYPIMVSNDSDPFAKSNFEQFASIFDVFTDIGTRFVFQTRGGNKAKNVLSRSKPTCVYISFTSDDNNIISRAEVGAPDFDQRKDLALFAKQYGHHVIIGINPYVADWWRDIDGFVTWLKDNGFGHVWLGEMHINHMQKPKIKSRPAKEFASIIEMACKKKKDQADYEYLLEQLKQADINVYDAISSTKGDFWQPYFDLNFPFFPTLDSFFTELRQHGRTVAFNFDFFDEYANVFPDWEGSEFSGYLASIGRSLRNIGYPSSANNFKQVHETLWRIADFPTRLRHDDLFLATDDGSLVIDEQGRSILVYRPGIDDPDLGNIDVSDIDTYLVSSNEE
ncbi:hypothetical protein [Moraxella catarrhalis]|uniref:hypothetical protein n=1 Tax=Moraxella catarrhalis TaxID=480 RepID=UPI000EA8564F|nr:hypothetical protein [Moraxella catarrhalis]RKM33452.1 hypothetical protein D6D62_06475 [Moraxella catarrhalis]